MSKTTFKQVLLGEARRDDLEYTEEKTKGVVDKVITELKGSESAVATKLARRFHNLGKAIKVMETKHKELNQQLTGMVEGVFDEATDQVVSRVVQTASFTIAIAKQEQAKEKTEVNYEGIYKQLLELVSPELEDKVKEIIEANTKRWTPDPKKPALRVKPLEEGKYTDMAKDALASVVANIKSFAKDLLKSLKLWGRTYDAKLKDLQKEAGIKKIVTEGQSDTASELKKLMAEVNASKDFDGIKMTLDRDISTTAGPNNMAGKMTATFKFTLPFDAATDYTKKHVEFYGRSSEEVGQRYPHIFRDLGEQKMYDVLKKVYAYFDKKFDGKLSWSYQRAFGDKKAKFTIDAFAQVLITPASVTEGQAVGWYVENKDGKTVAGPMAEAAAKKKAQELGGDAKGFSATYVSDYDAKRMCESLDADELFDKFIDANRMYSFEGSRGVSNLEKLIRVLGYRDLHEFFSDNSGAIEGVVEWIKEWTERNDEWKQALLDEVGGEEDNQ